MGPASTTLQPVEPLAADHVKADMDRAMCCSGSWGWPFSGVYTGYCLCFYSWDPLLDAAGLVACGGGCSSAGRGLPLMVSGSGSLLASATVPIMVVRGRCACLHSACCGRPTSDGLKALKVLGARYATLRVVRGLGACITHQGLGSILAVCSPGLSRWACGPFLPHWLSRVFQF